MRPSRIILQITDCHKNEAFPLMKCIRRYVQCRMDRWSFGTLAFKKATAVRRPILRIWSLNVDYGLHPVDSSLWTSGQPGLQQQLINRRRNPRLCVSEASVAQLLSWEVADIGRLVPFFVQSRILTCCIGDEKGDTRFTELLLLPLVRYACKSRLAELLQKTCYSQNSWI